MSDPTAHAAIFERRRRRLAVVCRLFWVGLSAFVTLCTTIYVIEHSEREQACLMLVSPLSAGPAPEIDYDIKITTVYPPGYGPQDHVYVLWDKNRSAINGLHQYLNCPEPSYGNTAIYTVAWDNPKTGKRHSVEISDPSLKPDLFYIIFTNDDVYTFDEWSSVFPSYFSFVDDMIGRFFEAIEPFVR